MFARELGPLRVGMHARAVLGGVGSRAGDLLRPGAGGVVSHLVGRGGQDRNLLAAHDTLNYLCGGKGRPTMRTPVCVRAASVVRACVRACVRVCVRGIRACGACEGVGLGTRGAPCRIRRGDKRGAKQADAMVPRLVVASLGNLRSCRGGRGAKFQGSSKSPLPSVGSARRKGCARLCRQKRQIRMRGASAASERPSLSDGFAAE